MHAEFFDFPPTHTLHLSTNHKPEIRGTDLAIWRRIRLVPWTVTIPPWDQDRELPKKLRGELPGILAWIVRGCAEWQSSGLDAPEEVRKATEAYRTEMDTLAAFIEDRCVVREGLVAPATRLYKRYQMWCDDAGEKPHTQRTFGVKLGERGFESTKITRGPYKDLKGWVGIGLRTNETDPDDPDPDPEDPDDPDGPSSSRAGEQSRASGNDDLRDVHNAPSNEREGPLSGRTADDRPLPKNAGFAGDSSEVGGESGRSGHKKQVFRLAQPRVREKPAKKVRFIRFVRSASGDPLSDDLALRYLAPDGGWTPDAGKAAVLGPATFLDGPDGPIRYHGPSPRVVSYESGEPYDVYVGRGKRGTPLKKSKWHNPFVMDTPKKKRDGDRGEVIEKFTRAISFGPVENYEGRAFDLTHLKEDLPELVGKTLCCHCAPEPCHADVLLDLAATVAELAPYIEEGMTLSDAAKASFKDLTGAYWVNDQESAEEFLREFLGDERQAEDASR